MKKFLLSLGLLLGLCAVAQAQSSCVGVGGVNNVPIIGVTCPQEPAAPSYGATALALVAVTGATDVACISGSATRIVRVQKIAVSGTVATASITVPVNITKHVSADTGGTPATALALPVPYAMDSANVAATATTISWTANPTITDAAPGIIDGQTVTLNLTTSAGFPAIFDFRERNFIQAPTLRGVAQQVCVSFNATAFANATSVTISFQWTELPF